MIGESDPEGCAACREPRDAYRNGTMYSSYTAASFPRKVRTCHPTRREFGRRLPGRLNLKNSRPSQAFANWPVAASICPCSTSSACWQR